MPACRLLSGVLLMAAGCHGAVQPRQPSSPAGSQQSQSAAPERARDDAPDPIAHSFVPADSDWTSEALYDLARVRQRQISDVPHCQEGMPNFTATWLAIDAWGGVVGQVRGEAKDGHEYVLVSGSRGAGVFVRAKGWAAPSARWIPSAGLRRSAQRWLSSLRRDFRAPRFFQTRPPAALRRSLVALYATGFVIAQHQADGWRAAFSTELESGDWPQLELRSIVDMNGDGVPELIVHFNEFEDGGGHELVIASADGGDSYREIADNHDDCP